MSEKVKTKGSYQFAVPFFLVIANMVGTGVFTSLGFQVVEIKSVTAILLLWLWGGVIALTGAFSYAEISTLLKRSGGEYHFLTEIYHPGVGFMAGWVSVIIGFSAPLAAVSISMGHYLNYIFPNFPVMAFAFIFLGISLFIHLAGMRPSGIILSFLTGFKVLLILGFCCLPFLTDSFTPSSIQFTPKMEDLKFLLHPSFAVSLVYVSYSYSGWNSSSYITGIVKDPVKNLPRSLILGTVTVTLLYLLLNGIFLYTAEFSQIAGKVDIGNIVLNQILGEKGPMVFSIILTVILLSSANGLMMAGIRVIETIGEDYPTFNIFMIENKRGAPYYAILLQGGLAAIMVGTSSFEALIKYCGLTLSLFSVLTVSGLFILKKRKSNDQNHYKAWGYPFTPIVFILFSVYMIIFLSYKNPMTVVTSLLTCLSGGILYFLLPKRKGKEGYKAGDLKVEEGNEIPPSKVKTS